jgi:hypothetical protein
MIRRFQEKSFWSLSGLPGDKRALKLLFTGMFLAQSVLASLSGLIVRVLVPVGFIAGDHNGQLIWFSLGTVFLGLVMAVMIVGKRGKSGTITGTILGAVVLSSPAWYLTLSIVTGAQFWLVIALALQVVFAYALGLLLLNFLDRIRKT